MVLKYIPLQVADYPVTLLDKTLAMLNYVMCTMLNTDKSTFFARNTEAAL